MQHSKETLECPQPVRIREIAEEKMGITLITDKSLSDDLSIFGETIFVEADVDVLAEEEPEKLHCVAGTVLLDPDVFMISGQRKYDSDDRCSNQPQRKEQRVSADFIVHLLHHDFYTIRRFL